MKIIKSLAIIFLVSFLGEALHVLLPFLPIPASIYGLVIMLAGLLSGAIKLESVQKTAGWLIAFMPLMFIGPSVQLMVSLRGQGTFIPAFVIISIVSTIVVMAVTGMVCQALIRKRGEGPHD
ncbi:MAG: CidA/LrgA family protein [Clostridiales bacterium]|nr:CidA/LrgA family protein [Clostridiales bacterium]